MAEVVPLFHGPRFNPARWVADWEALGGRLFVGDPVASLTGHDGASLLELSDITSLSDTPGLRVSALRRQVEDWVNRAEVARYLERRKETRGW